MRSCHRNQYDIYYSVYTDDGDSTDKWGNRIGTWSEPIESRVSLTTDKNYTQRSVFGQDLDYEREMSVSNPDYPVDEYSRLWIGIDSDQPYNYMVVRVAKTKNESRYAIKRVER